jgi:MFS family permease
MSTVLAAALGVKALYFTYAWLLSCVASSWLSDRKGYGERPGLITSLLLTVLGTVIWLLIPAKPDSRWKVQGAIPRRGQQKTVAEARAERTDQG